MKLRVRKVKMRPMMPQQINYNNYASSRNSLACLMEMRLGKTLANIRHFKRIASDQGKSYPILVVAPLSVIEAWEKELKLELETYVVVHGMRLDKRAELVVQEGFSGKGRVWVLINYDGLRCTPGIATLPWFAVALDESPLIKNPNAQISKVCCGSFQDVKHKAILTGLPSPEGELDLFQQFKFLYGSFMGCNNYWEYRNKYFELKWDGWQPKTKDECKTCRNDYILKYSCPDCKGKGIIPFDAAKLIKDEVHKLSFVLTRQQAGLGSKKIKEIRYIPVTKEQRKLYDKIEEEFVGEVVKGNQVWEKETDHIIVQQTWLARAAGGCDIEGNYIWPAKTKELISLLKGELKDQPVVVGFRFTSEIKANAEALRKAGILCNTLTGDDSREVRKQKQDWFRTCKTKSRVLLVQIKKVAEYGVDMSVSSTMILYSVTYSCNEMAQFEERINHPSKSDLLLYLYLVSKGTIDEDVVEAVLSKISDSKMFMKQFRTNFLTRIQQAGASGRTALRVPQRPSKI